MQSYLFGGSQRVPLSSSVFMIAVACALFVNTAIARAETDRLPNIVIIFTDDQGYADLGTFGEKQDFETPHLDRMAAEGMRFDNWYVSQAVCSASRSALLTGCYNVRVGIYGALSPRSTVGIAAAETTLAEICKQKGYATAIFGKWHLGHHQPFLPLQHGFDEYFGLPYSNDMWPLHPMYADLPPDAEKRKRGFPDLPLYEGNEVIKPKVTGDDQAQLTTQYTERAVKFIKKNKDKPFFLYVPHSMPHVPLFVSDKFKGKSKQGMYGDVIMEIDWSVGEIIKALKETGVDDNTLVVFTTDNGPWISYGDHAGSALPLREAKGTSWDGGTRTPCIMRFPGKVPAGKTCSEVAATIDLLPTVAKLIGAKLPDHTIDGEDIWPLMTGQPGAKSPHEAYLFYSGPSLDGIRSGKWKLHFPHGYRTLNGRKGGTGGKPVPYEQAKTGLALYDLENDIGETTDVKDQYPEVVKRLQALADKAREDLGDRRLNIKGKGVRSIGRLPK